jgi:hypothetical protein
VRGAAKADLDGVDRRLDVKMASLESRHTLLQRMMDLSRLSGAHLRQAARLFAF